MTAHDPQNEKVCAVIDRAYIITGGPVYADRYLSTVDH